MLPGRSTTGGTSGRTRVCPHCKATILESAVICPQCRHHLKFGAAAVPQRQVEGFTALRVQGELTHAESVGEWEYTVVMSIRNERGEEVSRQVVGVGALRPNESRSVTLTVDVTKPGRPR